MNDEIKLVRYITLRYADPICAIDLNDKYLVYGTMLGTAACYIIDQKRLITLSETQDENVSGIKLQENKENPKESKLFVSIGDDKIILYNSIGENLNEIPKYEEIYNYQSENEHYKQCEKCYTMLKNNYLVRTFIEFPNEVKTPSNLTSTEILIKNLLNLNEKETQVNIDMSNYCVPFDFDGDKYVFIDFIQLMDVADIKESESYQSGACGDLLEDPTEILLEEGEEPGMKGPIKTATSVADALTLQYYEEADARQAAFGHKLTEAQWRQLHGIVDTYTAMLFTTPLGVCCTEKSF